MPETPKARTADYEAGWKDGYKQGAWAGADPQELYEGFTAADIATASAQRFGDGAASLAASVGSELVYQARYQKGFWQDSSRERYEYLQNPENTCADDWETRILYTHPPTAQAEGWVSVEERLPDLMVDVLAGYWYQDTWMKGKPSVFSYGICRMYEMLDDPCFPQGKRWKTHGCTHSQITHWMPLPLPPHNSQGGGA